MTVSKFNTSVSNLAAEFAQDNATMSQLSNETMQST